MISRIATFLFAFAALGAEALAHPGHIADQGHGHDHWFLYVLAACAAQGIIVLLAFRMTLIAKAKRRS
ncbi:MAG: DUF6732 family protein [Methyloligellaceae bacterium]